VNGQPGDGARDHGLDLLVTEGGDHVILGRCHRIYSPERLLVPATRNLLA
jgi:hypothetical protein